MIDIILSTVATLVFIAYVVSLVMLVIETEKRK